MTPEEILAADRAHVWHPYGRCRRPADAATWWRAPQGVRLRLADGRELVDGMSSWWAAIHGYRHPVLDAAVTDQLGRMSHVMFGGLTHEPAVRLATHPGRADPGRAGARLPGRLRLGQRRGRGQDVPAVPAGRRAGRSAAGWRTWRGGYHGDTFHPMSVCDPEGGMHHLWGDVLPRQVFAPVPPGGFDTPPDPAYVAALVEAVERHAARAGRGDRRAGGPGRRRDALPPSALPAGAARGDPGARRPADLRRDRHRLRAYRRAVRRRARRGDART